MRDAAKAARHRNKAAQLNKLWGVGAKQVRYSDDGTWYSPIERFPAALFDAHGFVLFDTEAEYQAAPLGRGKQIGVPKPGISAIPGYVRVSGSAALSEEVTLSGKLIEGAVCRVVINAYERNPVARARCIAHYGPSCVVCGVSFGAVYGLVAEGFIHVHHVKPLWEIGEEYELDPVADLRPVCPNCHAVIHLGGACRSIEEVRQLLELGTTPKQRPHRAPALA
jgi:hypothetical protein